MPNTNAVDYAVKRVMQRVNKRLLRDTLLPKENAFLARTITVESAIREKIIQEIVMTDINLKGGVLIHVDIDDCPYQETADGWFTILVPPQLRRNSDIISAVGVQPRWTNAGTGHDIHQAPHMAGAQRAGDKMWNTMGIAPNLQSGDIYVKSHDQLVMKNMYHLRQYMVSLIIGYDEALTTLHPGSWIGFADGVVHATKAYIYHTLDLDVGDSEISQGAELGRYRDILDSYADNQELYDEWVKHEWPVIALCNDPQRYDQFISMSSGIR